MNNSFRMVTYVTLGLVMNEDTPVAYKQKRVEGTARLKRTEIEIRS